MGMEVKVSAMDSVRKALRAGAIKKDTYGRLMCAECDVQLGKRTDPEGTGSIRSCPECGREWHRLD